MSGQHMGDTVLIFIKSVVQIEHRAAGIAENRIHPLLQQALHQNIRSVFDHGFILSFRIRPHRPPLPAHKKTPSPYNTETEDFLRGTTPLAQKLRAARPHRAHHRCAAPPNALPVNGGSPFPPTRMRFLSADSSGGDASPGPTPPRTAGGLSGEGHSGYQVPRHSFWYIEIIVTRSLPSVKRGGEFFQLYKPSAGQYRPGAR